MNRKYYLAAAIAGVLIVVYLVYIAINNTLHFKITSYDPQGTSPVLVALVLDFNKSISTSELGDVVTTPAIDGFTKIRGKRLYYYPKKALVDRQKYDVSISGYTSTDGIVMDDFAFSFTTSSNNKKTTQAQYDAQILATDATDQNPLLSKLPYDNFTYKLTAVVNGDTGDTSNWRDFKDNYFIKVQTFAHLTPGNAAQYKADTLRLRQDALKWIRDQGADPAKDIRLVYEPSDEALAAAH